MWGLSTTKLRVQDPKSINQSINDYQTWFCRSGGKFKNRASKDELIHPFSVNTYTTNICGKLYPIFWYFFPNKHLFSLRIVYFTNSANKTLLWFTKTYVTSGGKWFSKGMEMIFRENIDPWNYVTPCNEYLGLLQQLYKHQELCLTLPLLLILSKPTILI